MGNRPHLLNGVIGEFDGFADQLRVVEFPASALMGSGLA